MQARLLGAVGIVAVVVGGLAAQAPAKPLAFEVASVKVNKTGDRVNDLGFKGGLCMANCQVLKHFAAFATSLGLGHA